MVETFANSTEAMAGNKVNMVAFWNSNATVEQLTITNKNRWPREIWHLQQGFKASCLDCEEKLSPRKREVFVSQKDAPRAEKQLDEHLDPLEDTG